MVTPFDEKGGLDLDSLSGFIEFQVKEGVTGLVPCGTTGESATLSHEEHRKVIEFVVKTVGGRIPVIAGTGSNNTRESIELTKFAESAGADAALLICPYYNKPTQEGLYEHFKTIAGATKLPLILYDIPSRTGVSLAHATLKSLVKECPRIIGVKEATGSLLSAVDILENFGAEFSVLSGEDALTYPLLAVGGHGVISVLSNVVPAKLSKLVNLALKADYPAARRIFYELLPLTRALFLETNPAPVKKALEMMGKIRGGVRLPLIAVRKDTEKTIKDTLSSLELLPA